MKTTHPRNVAGMQAAPRCQALTKVGTPCQKPANRGTSLCQSHAYEPVQPAPRAEHIAYQRHAYVEQQQAIRGEAREIEKLIRRVKTNQMPGWLLDELGERRESLLGLADREAERPRNQLRKRVVAATAEPLVRTVPSPAVAAVSPGLAKTHAELAAERTRDRALGAMLGLAVGEAVGVTTTGFERSPRERSGMHGGGKLGLKRGEWAWDTAAMLALSDSLLADSSFDERDFIERLVDHRDSGSYASAGVAVGLGNMTAVALNRFGQTRNPIASNPDTARPTNGCLARMAPVAVRFWKQPERILEIAERQSRVTHAGDGLAQLSASFAQMVALAIDGHNRASLLSERYWDKRSCRTVTFGELRMVPKSSIISGDDARESFAAALWCVATGDGFEAAVHKALNLAGDATSIGAMAGQLAGAIYGACTIPADWLKLLAARDRIEETALQLFDAGMAEA